MTKRDPVLIVRVTRRDPGFTPGEPVEYVARAVEPWRPGVGRGLTMGAALDGLLGAAEEGRVTVIVDGVGVKATDDVRAEGRE